MSQSDVLLIANVGNHDVQLVDAGGRGNKKPPPPRELGEAILADFEGYRQRLSFPLLAPTLEWIREKHFPGLGKKTAWSGLHVVLFASDQPERYTDPGERAKDTKPFAEVIRRWLEEEHRLPPRNVYISTIEGNPADYSNMLDFYVGELQKRQEFFTRRDGMPQTYLEVAGGTPAMTSMLIVAGVEVLGENVGVLYVSRDTNSPQQIPIAGQLFGQKTRAILRRQVEEHTYAAALRTMQNEGHYITPDVNRRTALTELLRYVERRLAFDFKRARAALEPVYGALSGEKQAQVGYWMRQLSEPEEPELLDELWHSMNVQRELEEYAAFVQRAFLFQERMFRYMAEQMGMQTIKKGREVDPAWARDQEGLAAFLGKRHVNIERTLNRVILGAIVDYFVQHERRWARWQDAAQRLHKLSEVAKVRNEGLSGHGMKGIGKADIEGAYKGSLDALMDNMAEAYATIFEQTLGPSPYQEAESLILELIADR